jgi:hypothetical protein
MAYNIHQSEVPVSISHGDRGQANAIAGRNKIASARSALRSANSGLKNAVVQQNSALPVSRPTPNVGGAATTAF